MDTKKMTKFAVLISLLAAVVLILSFSTAEAVPVAHHAFEGYGPRGCERCHLRHHDPSGTNNYYIKSTITIPSDGTDKTVVLTADTGPKSFADGDTTYDGVCEVCHTQTSYHTNTDDGTTHYDGEKCIDCHLHSDAFLHSGASGGGCEECHGHDAGYEYAPGEFSQGAGSYKTHSTHTENDDADEYKGPNPDLACDACHDTANYPYFKSGIGDPPYDLSETDVCDVCHSPGGFYNGINDLNIGAKNNWADGAYDGNVLKTGKEKWCVGCHDDVAANSQQDGNGVSAPNIAGDESTLTYGFYVSGHGRPSASKGCLDCHDATVSHIDGDPRTYAAASDNYRAGYRLNEDMTVPRSGEAPAASYDLCVLCHPWADLRNVNITNFQDSAGEQIHHDWHVGMFNGVISWDSDWNGAADSAMNCTACHNVHGSPMDDGGGTLYANPVMIRHGELISSPGTTDKVPAVDFRWLDGNGDFTDTLAQSRKGGMTCSSDDLTVNNVCSGCHPGRKTYTRTPN